MATGATTQEASLAATSEAPEIQSPTPPASGTSGADMGNKNQTRLQEILPQIKDLAQQVGGLKKLSEIVNTLAEAGEA